MAGLQLGRSALGAYALAAILMSQALADDWTFFTPTGGQPPNAIQAADFNNDGQPDIVATTDGGGQGQLALLIWTPERQYADVRYFSFSGHPRALATGDFNRDGNQDVAVAFTGDGAGGVRIFLGDGHGNLTQTPSPVMFVEHPNAAPLDLISATLVNGSGRTDLAATISGGANENFVVVMLNRFAESGDFSTSYIDTTTPSPSIAAFSTFRFVDLFVASDRVARLEGLGDGRFLDPVDFWCPGMGLAVCTSEIGATPQSTELLDTANPSRLRVGAFTEGERFLGIIDRTLLRFTALHRGPVGGFDDTAEIPLPGVPKRLFVADIGNGQFFSADNLQDGIILDDSDNVTAAFQTTTPPFFGPTQTLSNRFCSTVALAASAHVPPSPPRLPFVAVTGLRCSVDGGDGGVGGEGGCSPLCVEH